MQDYFYLVSHEAVRIGDVMTDLSPYDSLIAEAIAYDEAGGVMPVAEPSYKIKEYTEGLKNKRVEFLEVLDALAGKQPCEHLIGMHGPMPEGGWTRGAIVSAIHSLGDEDLSDLRCEIKNIRGALEYAKEKYPEHEAGIDQYIDTYGRIQGFRRREFEEVRLTPEQIKKQTAQKLKDFTANNKKTLAERAQTQKGLEIRLKQRAKSRSLPESEKMMYQDQYDRFRKQNRTMSRMTRSIMRMEKKKLARQYQYENGMLSDRAKRSYEKNAEQLMDKSIDLQLYVLRQVKETESVLQFATRDSDMAKLAIAQAQHLKNSGRSPQSALREKALQERREAEKLAEGTPFVRKADEETRQKSKVIKEYMREQRKEKEAGTRQTSSPEKQKSTPGRSSEERTGADELGK